MNRGGFGSRFNPRGLVPVASAAASVPNRIRQRSGGLKGGQQFALVRSEGEANPIMHVLRSYLQSLPLEDEPFPLYS
jgi:hypothetical protein